MTAKFHLGTYVPVLQNLIRGPACSPAGTPSLQGPLPGFLAFPIAPATVSGRPRQHVLLVTSPVVVVGCAGSSTLSSQVSGRSASPAQCPGYGHMVKKLRGRPRNQIYTLRAFQATGPNTVHTLFEGRTEDLEGTKERGTV